MTDFIYLDCNATTPVDPRVAEAMHPFLTGVFGNPSSLHRLGREARSAVDGARAQVARCLGARVHEIVFTSGGSESNNLAIRGTVEAAGGGHVITSAVEHPAVLEVVRALRRERRADVAVVGVDSRGRVDPDEVEASIRPDTLLVSLMLANNEVGTIQPVAEVARRCRARGVLCHTDAAQAVGKVAVDVADLGVDLLSVAGHKLYGPKGIGALYVREGVRLEPLIRGAGHERGLRAGTENVLAQVGLGAACELAARELDDEGVRVLELRERLRQLLGAAVPDLLVHGLGADRLPNTLSVALGVNSAALLGRLADRLAASAGAACHADRVRVSHVLEAMGVTAEAAVSTVRLSLGRFTTRREVDAAADLILEARAAVVASGGSSAPAGV